MYHFTYSTILSEGPHVRRESEREVLLQSVELMELAERAGQGSPEVGEAVRFVQRLWCHLIEDLGHPDNDLPKDLRAKLISIGLFLIRRSDEINAGTATSFRGMIDITRLIAEGLK
jgi:flagellar biosynthesis activator protein FlaF